MTLFFPAADSFRHGSRPFVADGGKNSLRGEIVHVAVARLRVLGKPVAQGAGKPVAELAGQTDEQVVVGEIDAERQSHGVVLSIPGLRIGVGGVQMGFGIQGIARAGADGVGVSTIRHHGGILVGGGGGAGIAVGERA